MTGLFANPLAQRAFSYLMKKAGFDARKAINLVAQKMNDNQGLLKLMKEYGYEPTKMKTKKTTSVDKPLGPGGKR